MKKVIFLLIFALLLATCNSVKKTQRAINEGNYERAISLAVENLKQNKVKKKNQPYVLMLEDAYKKANDRDLQRISFLKKENNAAQLETIYELFEKLKRRQQKIKPLLPLQIKDQNREANFKFVNYDNEIIATKKQLSDNLYQNARQLFDADNKFDYRTAYDDLAYLENINPNFKDVRNLMNIARDRGVDYVIVSMKNETEKVVPKRLEEDLLNFDTYGLDDLWTIYHGSKNNTITYDFSLELNLRNILVSPEKIREKELVKERQVKDGFTYL